MAGGKQSPRDKMIGMMYLVLTALLALQVGATVLEKFVFINMAFEASNADKEVGNNDKITSISGAVKDAGGRPQDIAVLEKAEAVRAETKRVLGLMDDYKDELVKRTGGIDPETKVYIGMKDIDAASAMFVNEKKGDDLKKLLNDYSAYLKDQTGMEEIEKIAKDAIEISLFADDPNQRKKGFAELNFGHNTPMVGALASLSQLQSDVITEETKVLEFLQSAVGAGDLKFDQIVAMVKPMSKIVAAGTKYEADMFIAASSSAVTPTMTLDGKDLAVEGGMGKISFTATPGKYDKYGNVTKTFEGAITVKMPGGQDTTFTNTIEYIVSKPVLQIQSASVQALYLNCGNELNVQVPALGSAYNPTFSAKGATTVASSDKGVVTIIPKSAKVTLSVSNNGNLVGSQDFKVRRIPKPDIIVLAKGRPVDLKRGMKGVPRSLKLSAKGRRRF